MTTIAPETTRTLRCVGCGGPARFLTPLGVMCPADALLAAILQDSTQPDGWTPILIGELDPRLSRPPFEVAAPS
jgi:hypothetical protein